MRVAFYAPLKPPSSSVPSGDRQMARALIAALARGGHAVEVAAILRSRDGVGDPERQRRIAALGARMADRLIRRFRRRARDARPDAWLTYHLYHKAPDWLGPRVTEALGIPYLIAEASFAPKRADGPWALGHAAAADAIRRADAVIGISSHDAACVRPLLAEPGRLHALRPFADIAPFAAAAKDRPTHRAWLAATLGLDPNTPILLAVAMMRPGDKLASYRVLGQALSRLRDAAWQLVVVGDGPARSDVAAAFASVAPERIRFAGERTGADVARFCAGADLLVWPAINEAYGIALLEAQAAGTPVVAGKIGGVGDIVRDGETGLLVPANDVEAFAAAVRALLRAPDERARMSAAAKDIAASEHSLDAAVARLDGILAALAAGVPA